MNLISAHKTEKCLALSQQGTYMFQVPAGLSKQAIKASIEQEFKVKVTGVTVTVRKGKVSRKMVTKRKAANVTRPNTRLAYVHLAAGQTIPMFEEEKAKKEEA